MLFSSRLWSCLANRKKDIIFTGTFLHTNTNLTIIKKNRGVCHASNSHDKVLNTLYSISIIIKILLITSLQRTKLKCHTLIGLNMTRDCKIYFLMFDRLDLRCAIWPKLCLIISFLHHYENYTFLKRFKCTWFTNRYTFFFLIIFTNVLNKCTNNFI